MDYGFSFLYIDLLRYHHLDIILTVLHLFPLEGITFILGWVGIFLNDEAQFGNSECFCRDRIVKNFTDCDNLSWIDTLFGCYWIYFCFESTASESPCPVDCSCRIYRLHLCRGVRLPPNDVLGYEIKSSDGEALGICGMWSTPSLPLLLGPLWPGEVTPNRFLSMDQINKLCVKKMIDIKLWLLYSNTWKH